MGKIRKILLMEEHVCPSWLYFSLSAYFRKKFHEPEKILSPYVKEGQTALDLGCGPGFFTIGLAGIVGKNGRVIAVDIQQKAVDIIVNKIRDTVNESVVTTVLAQPGDISVKHRVDFALSFWMLHEVPDKKEFIRQVRSVMRPGSLYLLVEPKIHVTEKSFISETEIIKSSGMELIDSPNISLSRAALFKAAS